MKKLYFVLLAVAQMMLFSCDSEYEYEIPQSDEIQVLSTRTLNEAYDEALAANSVFGSAGSRGSEQNCREINFDKTRVVCNTLHSRSSNAFDTLFYAINFKDDLGYVLISANRELPSVLAYVEDGTFVEADFEQGCVNDGKSFLMDMLKNYASIQAPPLNPFIPSVDSVVFVTGPLLTTKWGQNGIEGQNFPNGLAGCGNIALAQIMSYYEYPDTINLTYDEAQSSMQDLPWGLMKSHGESHESSGFCLAGIWGHNALANFCRQLAHMDHSVFDDFGTGCQEYDMQFAIRGMGYNYTGWHWYTDTCFVRPIQEGHPVLVSGSADYRLGHMWVVDGIKDVTLHYNNFHEVNPTIPSHIERHFYNHVNWGWHGQSNGYYLDGIFNVNNYKSLDPSLLGARRDYYYNTELQYTVFYK